MYCPYEQLFMAQASGIDSSQFPGIYPEKHSTAVAIRQRPRGEPLPVKAVKSVPVSPAFGVCVRKNIGSVWSLGCSCKCHLHNKSSSAGYLGVVVGRLFLGYSGLPLLISPCGLKMCRRKQALSVSAESWFSMGLCWSQIIRFQISYQSQIGPEWELSSLRGVPDSAECVKLALEGDINGLKALFQYGITSPKDVSSTRGYSILRVGYSVSDLSQVH